MGIRVALQPLSFQVRCRSNLKMTEFRIEKDSMGEIPVPADKLWGAQTQRSLQYFSIGDNLMPREMIGSYAILKKACAIVNQQKNRLSQERKNLICQVCDEILAGQHADNFPLYVWMTGSGTQFNTQAGLHTGRILRRCRSRSAGFLCGLVEQILKLSPTLFEAHSVGVGDVV